MKPSISRRLQQMDDDLQRLLDQLATYEDEALNRKPAGGGWSVLQVMHHLLLAEEGSQKYIEKKLSFNPKLEKAGLRAAWRSFLLSFYLNLPFKFKAPRNVGDDVLPERSEFKVVADRWRESRRSLRQLLEGLPEELFGQEVYKHPFAGRMSLQGMIVFFSHHFARHEKQIQRVLKQAKGS